MHACMPVEHELADAVVEAEEVRVGEAGALLVPEAPDGLVEPDGDVDGEDAAGERLHGHGAAHRVQQRPQPQHSHGGAGSKLQGANICQSHTYIHFTAGYWTTSCMHVELQCCYENITLFDLLATLPRIFLDDRERHFYFIYFLRVTFFNKIRTKREKR